MVGYPLSSHAIIILFGTPCLVSCTLQALQLSKIAYDFSFRKDNPEITAMRKEETGIYFDYFFSSGSVYATKLIKKAEVMKKDFRFVFVIFSILLFFGGLH